MIDIQLAPQTLPDWLLARYPKRTQTRHGGNRVAELASNEIPEGQRNTKLTGMAGAMRRQGATYEKMLPGLLAVNTARCKPPLTEEEVMEIVLSVCRYEPEEPDTELTWEPRQELPSGTPSVPTIPADMAPEPLRLWIQDVAERACAPLEMIACPAITSLGALIGRKLGIRPEKYDDWLVVPNLWGGIVARPGFMKTHDISQGAAHLKRLAGIAHDRFEANKDISEASQDRLEAEIAANRDAMKKASKGKCDLNQLQEQLAILKGELREAAAKERRYLTQDATIEKLGELLQQNPYGILVLRDELAGWLRTLDKAGREGEREFYLESWNGTESYTFDRIQRGTVHVPGHCLSVFGGIQPGKLKSYIKEAITESGGADGLLQRLQLTVWPDALGEWKKPTKWPDVKAKNRAFAIFQYLDELDTSKVGSDGDGIPALHFSLEAQDLFDMWRDELEKRLRSEELANTPAFESHLAKYRSLMPSLALLFYLVDLADAAIETYGTFGTPISGTFQPDSLVGVSLSATRLAASWCDFLEQHARKIYATELYPGVEAAHALANKINEKSILDGETVRDIYRHHWSGLTTSDQVADGLNVLTECNWVWMEVQESTGGRPTEILRLHPELKVDNGD